MQLQRAGLMFLLSLASGTCAEASPAPPSALNMAPDVRQLFQAEMRELLMGTQSIAASLPVGNWESITRSALTMRDSYVLDKKLTTAQRHALDRLPEHFKALDYAFHVRAEKLADAAKAKDAEVAAFQFSRLLETCVACHSSYATAQFSGLTSTAREPQHHP